MPNQPWVVVLAGGEGTRIQPLIKRCLGFSLPKQYFTFCGRRSMLEHTYDRAVEIAGADRVITVIGSGHRHFLRKQHVQGLVMEQPMSRGTLAGVLLPVSHILAHEPEASILIFPSDHFICPTAEFIRQAELAREYAEVYSERMILMAATPDIPEPDYGWVEPGGELPNPAMTGVTAVREVRSFCEKPGREVAKGYFERGFLWNTMIIATKVKALWNLARKMLPEVIERFEVFNRTPFPDKSVERGNEQTSRLIRLYRSIPTLDFSSTLLTKAAGRLAVMPLQNIIWSDWGRPERVFESLKKIGRRPLFLDAARAWGRG